MNRLVVAIVLLTSTASAAEDRWYLYLGAGVSRPNYDSQLTELLDLQRARGGSSLTAGQVDLPGVYYRVNPRTLLGLVFNTLFEHVSRDWRYQDSLAYHFYNGNLSLMYFPSSEPGQGWFTRLDGGYCHFLQIRETPETPFRKLTTGVSTQAALGYGWKTGPGHHLLAHINYFYHFFPDQFARGFAVYMGFLF